jgi:hypothetical protein
MNIKITGDSMASASGRHTADLHHFEAGDAWRVSWLPERLMNRKFSDHGHDHRGVRGRA